MDDPIAWGEVRQQKQESQESPQEERENEHERTPSSELVSVVPCERIPLVSSPSERSPMHSNTNTNNRRSGSSSSIDVAPDAAAKLRDISDYSNTNTNNNHHNSNSNNNSIKETRQINTECVKDSVHRRTGSLPVPLGMMPTPSSHSSSHTPSLSSSLRSSRKTPTDGEQMGRTEQSSKRCTAPPHATPGEVLRSSDEDDEHDHLKRNFSVHTREGSVEMKQYNGDGGVITPDNVFYDPDDDERVGAAGTRGELQSLVDRCVPPSHPETRSTELARHKSSIENLGEDAYLQQFHSSLRSGRVWTTASGDLSDLRAISTRCCTPQPPQPGMTQSYRVESSSSLKESGVVASAAPGAPPLNFVVTHARAHGCVDGGTKSRNEFFMTDQNGSFVRHMVSIPFWPRWCLWVTFITFIIFMIAITVVGLALLLWGGECEAKVNMFNSYGEASSVDTSLWETLTPGHISISIYPKDVVNNSTVYYSPLDRSILTFGVTLPLSNDEWLTSCRLSVSAIPKLQRSVSWKIPFPPPSVEPDALQLRIAIPKQMVHNEQDVLMPTELVFYTSSISLKTSSICFAVMLRQQGATIIPVEYTNNTLCRSRDESYNVDAPYILVFTAYDPVFTSKSVLGQDAQVQAHTVGYRIVGIVLIILGFLAFIGVLVYAVLMWRLERRYKRLHSKRKRNEGKDKTSNGPHENSDELDEGAMLWIFPLRGKWRKLMTKLRSLSVDRSNSNDSNAGGYTNSSDQGRSTNERMPQSEQNPSSTTQNNPTTISSGRATPTLANNSTRNEHTDPSTQQGTFLPPSIAETLAQNSEMQQYRHVYCGSATESSPSPQ